MALDPLLVSRVLVVIHFAFLMFVIFGGFLVMWRLRLAWLHIPCAAWGVMIVAFGWICPLTPLENRYRAEAGLSLYEGGFIETWLLAVIYPPGLTREVQILLAVSLAVLLVLQYGGAWRLHRGRQARARERA
jgi:hypothetical protein